MEQKLYLYLLDKNNAGPFSPYLLPGVRRDIGAGREDILAIGAATEEHSVGALAAAVRDGILHLLCLYVDPAVRRQGVGSALLWALGGLLRKNDAEIGEVRTYYMEEEEDTEAIAAFLRSAGLGELQLYYRMFSVNTAELHDLPGMKEALSTQYPGDPHVFPYSAITPEQLQEIEDDESVLDCLKPSAMSHGILRQGSTIWVEDGHVLGWVLLYQGFDGEIVMTSACKRDGAPKGCFNRLMLSAANRCYMMLGRDFTVYISTINEHSGGLVESVTGGRFHEYLCYYTTTGDALPDWLLGEEPEA